MLNNFLGEAGKLKYLRRKKAKEQKRKSDNISAVDRRNQMMAL